MIVSSNYRLFFSSDKYSPCLGQCRIYTSLLNLPQKIYFHFFGRCVRAEAATDFILAGVFGLRNSFEAIDATFFEVLSFNFRRIKKIKCKKLICFLIRQIFN